jgi:hypothetical protein
VYLNGTPQVSFQVTENKSGSVAKASGLPTTFAYNINGNKTETYTGGVTANAADNIDTAGATDIDLALLSDSFDVTGEAKYAVTFTLTDNAGNSADYGGSANAIDFNAGAHSAASFAVDTTAPASDDPIITNYRKMGMPPVAGTPGASTPAYGNGTDLAAAWAAEDYRRWFTESQFDVTLNKVVEKGAGVKTIVIKANRSLNAVTYLTVNDGVKDVVYKAAVSGTEATIDLTQVTVDDGLIFTAGLAPRFAAATTITIKGLAVDALGGGLKVQVQLEDAVGNTDATTPEPSNILTVTTASPTYTADTATGNV